MYLQKRNAGKGSELASYILWNKAWVGVQRRPFNKDFLPQTFYRIV